MDREDLAIVVIGIVVVACLSLLTCTAEAGVAIADNGRERYVVCNSTGVWPQIDEDGMFTGLLIVGRDLDGDGETDNRVRFTADYSILDDQGKQCKD